MNISNYFISISSELHALKNRVRNFIDDNHWPTDGEWKESVLRTVLRRHLPKDIEVGRGFIVKRDGCSKQIDLLIYDASKPILYRDGDLVFITSDAVKGIIEVKSKAYLSNLREVLAKLADNAEFASRPGIRLSDQYSLYVGLFSYDSEISEPHSQRVLEDLRFVANGNENRVINHLSLGDSFFARFWATSPYWEDDYDKWRTYNLPQKAAGYFINNLVHTVAEDSVSINQDVWFPLEGKEDFMLGEIALKDAIADMGSTANSSV